MATGRVKRVVNKGAGARRRKPTQGGAAVVEFTLVLPILLNLLFVGYVLAQGYYKSMLLANAVRAGAQYAAVNGLPPDLTKIVAAVVEDATLSKTTLAGSPVAVSEKKCAVGAPNAAGDSCPSTPNDPKPRTYVRITASSIFTTGVPYLPPEIHLSQAVAFRVN